MSEFAPLCLSLVISLLVSLIPLGLLFCRNSLIAPYEFTMEKVLFVVRSLKEKLVINLESLLLHGNEDFREKRRKSQNKAHMARKGNPISVRLKMVLGRIALLLLCIVFLTGLCLVLGLECQQFLERLQSMLLGRGVRCLFTRVLGWDLPLFLFFGSVVGSSLHMMDPAGGQPDANPAAEQPSNGSSGASPSGWTSILGSGSSGGNSGWTSLLGSASQQPSVVPSGGSPSGGWTRFDEDVLLEAGASSSGHSNSNPSINQPRPGEQAMPPANPVASAGPSRVLPFPYDEEEVIGGDSVLSIRNRLLSKFDSPSAEQIEWARIEAEELFEIKVEIIRLMAPLDPEGDWERRGARALDNPRTKTGEESYARLCQIRDSLANEGIQSQFFFGLKERVFLQKENLDDESQA